MFGLDPDQAASAARVWASPDYVAAPVEMADGALTARANLGLPPAGSVGTAYLTLQPRMVREVIKDPSHPVIDVLADLAAGSQGGGRSTTSTVIEFYLEWNDKLADWRVTQHALDADRIATTTVPADSPAAYALGWVDAQEA